MKKGIKMTLKSFSIVSMSISLEGIKQPASTSSDETQRWYIARSASKTSQRRTASHCFAVFWARKLGSLRSMKMLTRINYYCNLLWDKCLWIFKPTKTLKVSLFQSDGTLFSSGIFMLTYWSEGPSAFLLLPVIFLMVEYL